MAGSAQVISLAGGAAALLAVRALVAAYEAALVGIGLSRARAWAAEAGAPPRARALAELVEAREPTAGLLRLLDAASAVGAGALAGAAGIEALPRAAPLGATLALVAAVLASLLLSGTARALGARHARSLALALAPPLRALSSLVGPVLRGVGRLGGLLARSTRVHSLPDPPLEEVERALAEYARAAGSPSDQSTSELIHAVFEFRDKVARDLMVPRTEVVAVEIDTPVPEILRLLAEEGHSRMPVYRESLDRVVGTLHARDLVPLLAHPELIVLQDLLRPPQFVPWSQPVDQLLREMQRRHAHMAVVVDEYGGVMGICTLEDVLEEIVGEIEDEFEAEEGKSVEAHPDGTYTVRADTPVPEFNLLAGATLPEDGQYETIGGFLNALAGAIPLSGDRFFHGGWLFTISEATPRRVLKVRAARVKRPPDRDAPARKR